MKRRAYELGEDGTVIQKKYVDVKFTLDERIADGFYYAAFLKHYKRILQHFWHGICLQRDRRIQQAQRPL